MYNIAKIKLNKNEKEELGKYREGLLNYLKILDEFDADSTYKKIGYEISPSDIKK
ncbi:MAG TPA: hypothetical protein VFC70_02490 [Oscillospiraceae bacterium]|nr:hypothetical protein [Oscillospiraceae bacterium]